MSWEFVAPWTFLLLPLPFFIWKFAKPKRVKSDALLVPLFREITDATGLVPEDGAVVLQRRRLQLAVAMFCWLMVVIGLARPELLGQQIKMEKSARDLMLAVDISASMKASDMVDQDGNNRQRLHIVKAVVNNFIADREGDRIGLIVFGSKAYVQSPFTEDLDTVQQMLAQTQVGMAGPLTAIGDAIGLSIRSFQSSEVDQRLMILLSDGADTSSMMSPINAAEIAAEYGVTIHTVGVGDPDAEGNHKVDLPALKDLAGRTGGRLFFADDEAGLTAIYSEIEALNPRITETVSFQPRQPVGWVAFAAGMLAGLLSLLWYWLSSRRRGT